MPSVISIADEILRIAKAENKSLTPLQLMKLVYIAHGWSLGLNGVDLFPERIEAWKFGPVIPELYRATKHFGRNSIPFSQILDGPSNLDASTNSLLKEVVRKYGHMSGYALSQLTHQKGTPWEQVYEEGVFGIEIPDDLIRCHYESLKNDRRSNSTAP